MQSDITRQFGGKAAGLMWLEGNGFHVPRFWTIPPKSVHIGTWRLELRGDKFAVRSSAPNEDGVTASFAGMFDTMLNVPREDVDDAIKVVQHTPARAIAYARALGLSDPPTRIPVIIMEMVDARYAGVAVVQKNGICIEVAEGLGDALVSGTVSPISSATIPGVMSAISRDAVAIWRFYGQDIDAEFVIDQEDKLWWLQCRPLTAPLPEFLLTKHQP